MFLLVSDTAEVYPISLVIYQVRKSTFYHSIQIQEIVKFLAWNSSFTEFDGTDFEDFLISDPARG